jgi:hypothetical protein
MMNWKGFEREQSWPNLTYYSSICLEVRVLVVRLYVLQMNTFCSNFLYQAKMVTRLDGFMCNCVQNARCTAVTDSVCVEG